MASGGAVPPEISVTTKSMTMKFVPDVGIYKEARNLKKYMDITVSVCKLQTKLQIFGSATSRHASFIKFRRIVHIDVRNKP